MIAVRTTMPDDELLQAGADWLVNDCAWVRMGLGDPVGFERLEEGHASQCKLANLSLDAAGFGHGKPMARDASTRFRNKYGKHSEDVNEQRSAA